jgi:hypothetical protein
MTSSPAPALRLLPLVAALWAPFLAMPVYAAQFKDPVEVQALPEWPIRGIVPGKPEKQFVFRDDRASEIVVSYPEPSDPGRATTFRFRLANRVDPQIAVELGRNSENLYSYRYRLANSPNAKTPIIMWNIVAPAAGPQLTMSHPTWRGINGAASRVAPQALLKDEELGVFLMWSGAEKSIAPGAEVKDFEILTSARPGLTTAYAVGEGGIVSPGEVPEEVVQQLIPLEKPSVMWKPFLAVGPRFGPDVPQNQIVRRYQVEITDLMSRGVLDPSSPYLIELRMALSKSAVSGRPEGFPIAAAPRSPFEKSLAKALDLSLFTK